MKLAQLAQTLGATLAGDSELEISGVAALEDATPGTLSFLADQRHAAKLASTRASAVIVGNDTPAAAMALLRVPHPYLAFVRATELLHPEVRPEPGVHPTAVIASSAEIGPGAAIGPYVVIDEHVRLGANAVLRPRVTIYARCQIGDDFVAHAGVVVRERVTIGNRVILHAGAVIGSDGFGYLLLPDGNRKIPQIGTVVIEDDVEIGANTTVDRAALAATVIASGTKIDNLVQVGHGCRIGRQSLLAAQVGLGGGTTLGARVMLGGQVGAGGHLTVGDGARVAAQAGIHHSIPGGAEYAGYPIVEARVWRRAMTALKQLPDMLRRLRRAERALGLGAEDE